MIHPLQKKKHDCSKSALCITMAFPGALRMLLALVVPKTNKDSCLKLISLINDFICGLI